MVSMIVKLQIYNIIPEFLLPVLPILLLIAISYLITKWIEPFIRKIIIIGLEKIGTLKYLKD